MKRNTVAAAFAFSLAAALAGGEDSAQRTSTPVERASPVQPENDVASDGRPLRRSMDEAGIAIETLSWHGAVPESLSIRAPADDPLLRRYIAQYTSPAGKKWLEAVMKRGAPYLPHIRSRIAEMGLPAELLYLPIIESAFSATAVSKSEAVGLWQFMRNSISPFGMRIDDWTDDRRDFWKATDGALRKLKENYVYFGDWPLALAAYNAGLGAVRRAVAAGKSSDYWDLSRAGKLKPETAHYVPKFIAVATVLSQAGRNGIDLGWPEDTRWTRIPVKKTVDLSLLAEKAGVPIQDLRTGNAELRYGVTPPDPAYMLKAREEHAAALSATLARQDLQLIRYYFHNVRSGDTLSAISRHYGVSVDLIERSNPGLEARYLKIGARILVPALKEVGPYKPDRSGAVVRAFDGEYLVKKGETLWSIALAFDVDPEQLAEANGMELGSVLREGRRLKTPILIAEQR